VYPKLRRRSLLNAVIYRGIALRLRFDLKDGMEAVARGRLAVYVPRGGIGCHREATARHQLRSWPCDS
jgi:exonuclease VII large subunit